MGSWCRSVWWVRDVLSLSLSVFNVNGWVTLVLAMTMVGFWSQGWDWIGLLWWGLITVVGLD